MGVLGSQAVAVDVSTVPLARLLRVCGRVAIDSKVQGLIPEFAR